MSELSENKGNLMAVSEKSVEATLTNEDEDSIIRNPSASHFFNPSDSLLDIKEERKREMLSSAIP